MLVIQNDPEVSLGTYARYLAEARIDYETIHAYAGEAFPDLGQVDAVIVLGGAMGVNEVGRYPFLAGVLELIARAVQEEVPFLGICLGGQLLAQALGGAVACNSPWGEKGTIAIELSDAGAKDPLFTGISRQFTTFQWHNDSFAIPPGAQLLASSSACRNQAFRFGSNAYGLQFHPEVDHATIENWISWTPETIACSKDLVADFATGAAEYEAASHCLLMNFLRLAGLKR
nr:type 1 glutamine amidotransferase [Geotalea sp. SG265]